ncbi:hypothetical protein C8R48DRAFT_677347 [Suillus tomentosus]|nr:hypothetical protein C8R48DRAFT_677347 [Suillus tomentosus]
MKTNATVVFGSRNTGEGTQSGCTVSAEPLEISAPALKSSSSTTMNNNANANEVGNRDGDRHGNQGHQIPEHLLRVAPRPRDVMFTLSERQLEMLYVRWDAARIRVHQQIYNPHLPFQPYPLPPAWSEEVRAMMILWVARERRMFELEMQELEYLLGLRGAR